MTATILNHAGLDPTVVVGGRVGTMGGSNARVGQQRFPGGGVRRERRLVPEARAHHRRGDQYRPRAPGPLPVARRDPRGLHRVRQQGAVLRRGHRLPGRRERAEHPARDQAPHHHLRHHRAGRHARPAISAAAISPAISALRYRGRRSGPFPPAHSRAAQRAERHGGGGGGAGTGGEAGRHSRRRWRLSAAWTGASRCAARSAASRWSTITATIPPKSAPRWRRAAVRLPARARAVPAAPLHAHLAPDGRIRARLPPGRQRCS